MPREHTVGMEGALYGAMTPFLRFFCRFLAAFCLSVPAFATDATDATSACTDLFLRPSLAHHHPTSSNTPQTLSDLSASSSVAEGSSSVLPRDTDTEPRFYAQSQQRALVLVRETAISADPHNVLRNEIEKFMDIIRARLAQIFSERSASGPLGARAAQQLALTEFDRAVSPLFKQFDDSHTVLREAELALRRSARIQDARGLFELAIHELNELARQLDQVMPPFLRLLAEATLGNESSVVVLISAPQNELRGEGFIFQLVQMYEKLARRNGWDFEALNDEPSDASMIFRLTGSGVYSTMVLEAGEHKQIFHSRKRNGTETRRVDVKAFREPTEHELVTVAFYERDVDISFFRRGEGPGGQNTNKVETAVRAQHRPTGIVVTCNVHRTQVANRRAALRMLRAQVFAQLTEQNRQVNEAIRAKAVSFQDLSRSRVVRTYNHRSGVTVGERHFEGKLEASLIENLRSVLPVLLQRTSEDTAGL